MLVIYEDMYIKGIQACAIEAPGLFYIAEYEPNSSLSRLNYLRKLP